MCFVNVCLHNKILENSWWSYQHFIKFFQMRAKHGAKISVQKANIYNVFLISHHIVY